MDLVALKTKYDEGGLKTFVKHYMCNTLLSMNNVYLLSWQSFVLMTTESVIMISGKFNLFITQPKRFWPLLDFLDLKGLPASIN